MMHSNPHLAVALVMLSCFALSALAGWFFGRGLDCADFKRHEIGCDDMPQPGRPSDVLGSDLSNRGDDQ